MIVNDYITQMCARNVLDFDFAYTAVLRLQKLQPADSRNYDSLITDESLGVSKIHVLISLSTSFRMSKHRV
jgi:hypothetical protein